MKSLVKIAALLVLAGCLAGCNAAAKVQMIQPKSSTISTQSTVALEVVAIGEAANDEDSEAVLQKLRSSLFGSLVANGIFKQVVHPGESADYNMKVELDGVRTVSQGARIFLGVLAGENELTAHCSLIETISSNKITDFTVTGESAAHPLSSENDMDDAVNKVVEKIVASLH